MRRALILAVCALGCGSEAPLLAPPPGPGNAAHPLPVVAIQWENQPDLPDDARPDGVPVSLTSGDGEGLSVSALSATAVVEDPLAFTELRFVFKNPEPRVIEGRFEITLPPNATISRFAMKQSDGWQEGEVVELEAARVAYEDALHRRVDPALLEKQAGNRFQARVFPIPPSGEKEIIFSYSQELVQGRDPYRVYLRGLPKIGRFDLRVLHDKRDDPALAGRRSFELTKTDFTPDHDFALALPASGKAPRGLRQERLAVARVTPVTEAAPDPVASLLVLFDTSASRALGFNAEVERLGRLVDALKKGAGPDFPLAVACFDQGTELVYDGPASGFGPGALDAIRARGALGASNLGKALRFASAVASQRGGKRLHRVLLMSDGIVTAGDAEPSALTGEMRGLVTAGIERLDALVSGGIRDEALFKQLAVGYLERDGMVLDGGRPTAVIAERLGQRSMSKITVKVPGSDWVWPPVLDGFSPGDQALVYASIPGNAPFVVELGGPIKAAPITIATTPVERPLLERALVNAEIQRKLLDRSATQDEKARELLKQQVIALSTKFRVLSDFTGLLILESDEDYARFHIDRTALANIMTVGGSGIELLDRARPLPVAQVAAAPPEVASEGDGVADKESSRKKDKGRPAEMAGAPEPPPPPPAAPGGAPPPQAPPLATAAPMQPRAAQKRSVAKEEEKPADAPKSAEARVLGPPPPPPPPPPSPVRAEPRAPRAPAANRPPAKPSPQGRQGRLSADPLDGDENFSAQPRRRPAVVAVERQPEEPEEQGSPPYTGKFAEVMDRIAKPKDALQIALRWHEAEPGDALALVAMGEVYEALGQKTTAARAYGSIIDLFPGRADLRRFAGARLEKLGTGQDGAFDLVVDTYRHAAQDRPDHPASHRLYAYALVRAGKPEEAFEAILAGATRGYPSGRFLGADRILWEDVGIVAAALIRAKPEKRKEVLERLKTLGVRLPTQPSLRFVLIWETDANDVDFHIRDARGGHAFFQRKQLPSGGELYADVTTGYGPECFTIEGRPSAYPYRLRAHYYSRGPMGYGMGKLEIMEHDGRGGLKFEERPFVVMTDHAFVDLGRVKGPLGR